MRYKLFAFAIAFLCFQYLNAQELIRFKENDKYGLKDESGKIIFEPEFLYISEFIHNKSRIAKSLDSVGVINEKGEILIPLDYEYISILDSTEYEFGKRTKYFGEYKMGVLDQNGNIKIPMKYNHVRKINGYIVTLNKDSIVSEVYGSDLREVQSFYGFYDLNGKLILEPKYNYISALNDNLIRVSHNDKEALYHVDGTMIFDFSDNYYYRQTENRVKFKQIQKLGFLDENGNVVIEPIYEYAFNFRHGFSVVRINDKCGTINLSGEVIREIKHDCKMLMVDLEKEYGALNFDRPEL